MGLKGPSELSEQIVVVRALRASGLLFCAVPNGGRRSRTEALAFKMSGVVAGAPDLLIFTPPPASKGFGGHVGTALEMKRAGGVPSDLRKEQRAWLEGLQLCGWAAVVGYGAEDAIAKLRTLGYRV